MTSVLTGDIIGSQQVLKANWLQDLKQAFNLIGNEPKYWQVYRGDSFQLEIQEPGKALKMAVFIKALIKQYKDLDVRIAIGIGDKSHDAEKITEANGTAFINSGQLFDELKKQNLAIRSSSAETDRHLNLCLELALLTMDHWTPNSAQAVKLALEKPEYTQQQLAETLDVTQSNVSARLKRAGFEAIQKLLDYYQEQVETKLTKP